MHAAGPPLPPDTPLAIQTSSGTYVRSDNGSSPAYATAGSGETAPEQYLAYDPANPASTDPIQPGDTTILKSVETGQYCRLAPSPANSTQLVVLCDQPTAATATPLTYTGSGLSYNGVPLVATGPGAPLMLANTTTAPVGSTDEQLTFHLTGEGRRAVVRSCVWVWVRVRWGWGWG